MFKPLIINAQNQIFKYPNENPNFQFALITNHVRLRRSGLLVVLQVYVFRAIASCFGLKGVSFDATLLAWRFWFENFRLVLGKVRIGHQLLEPNWIFVRFNLGFVRWRFNVEGRILLYGLTLFGFSAEGFCDQVMPVVLGANRVRLEIWFWGWPPACSLYPLPCCMQLQRICAVVSWFEGAQAPNWGLLDYLQFLAAVLALGHQIDISKCGPRRRPFIISWEAWTAETNARTVSLFGHWMRPK